MKPSTGAAVRLHRNAVRDRPESLSAFKWNACPPSPESAALDPLVTISADGKTLYMLDSRERDKAAFFAVEMATRKATLLAADDEADLVEVSFGGELVPGLSG